MWSLLRQGWNDLVTTEGGFALMWIDGLLLIPLIMAAFFFPVQVAEAVIGLVVLTGAVYLAWAYWRKAHPRGTHT